MWNKTCLFVVKRVVVDDDEDDDDDVVVVVVNLMAEYVSYILIILVIYFVQFVIYKCINSQPHCYRTKIKWNVHIHFSGK